MEDSMKQPLLAVEAEAYCQSLQKFTVKEVGSTNWSRQHEKFEKMNMQAVVNASAQEHEFIKEFLISESKYPVVVHDLLVTELWRDKVFTALVHMKYEPKITFPLYMVLYHEATIVNLLETTLYYQESCEACEDAVLDLIDYCHRKILQLTLSSDGYNDDNETASAGEIPEGVGSNLKELVEQDKTLQFDVAVKCLSVIRYICDHLDSLPLSCASRILNTQDFPVLLVEFLQHNPLSRYKDGKLQKYVDNKWQFIEDCDRFKITKAEGQVNENLCFDTCRNLREDNSNVKSDLNYVCPLPAHKLPCQ